MYNVTVTLLKNTVTLVSMLLKHSLALYITKHTEALVIKES